MNLVLIPLRVLQADAPANLATRVTSELQVECARHNTINICELSLRSPLMKRALELCDGDENAQNNLREDYRLVADAATDATTRREAATRLIQPLGVDAVLYGTIDVYAFTTKPSPNQTLISLTVEKVTLGEDAECEPVHLLGCSFIRPDGGGSKETHDLEAVTAAGGELARLLSYPWWLPGLPTTTVIW